MVFFGMSRFAYNEVLYWIKESTFGTYEIKKGKNKGKIVSKIPSLMEIQGCSTKLKEKFNFMKELPNDILQSELINLGRAFQKFYVTLNYPKFKTKQSSKQTLNFYAGVRAKFTNSSVTLPFPKNSSYDKELFTFKYKKHKIKYNFDKITGWTISKEGKKYFISFTFKTKIEPKNVQGAIGIDLGVKDLITTSNGDKIENPKFFEKLHKKLQRAQIKLNKSKKGSKRYEIKKLKLFKIHRKIKNKRMDYHHKVSRSIADNYKIICVETLRIKSMMYKNKFASYISDSGWSKLVSMLEYKALENQGVLCKIDSFYPSSKTCYNCKQVKESLPLKIRTFKCSCGYMEDRDVNAAKNILKEGLKLLEATAELSETS